MAQQLSKAIQHLQQKAQTLREAFEKVQSNRYYWQRKTKPLLETTLNQIRNDTGLNGSYQEVSNDSIRFVISDEQGEETAVLSFILTHNSRVSVDVSYHSRTYHPETKTQLFSNLYNLEPGLLDEELIYTIVTQFIDVILNEYNTKPATYKNLNDQSVKQYIRMRPGK
ncbi:hypothetical protein [Larkinella rosea]|uniref:Uncharacterized protein n=1 Tax=Larkinella rosea TaxID=2025312 RepID=A0A3P1BV79_9BACT|nr:hypothetical protein [Larkinella rosea]RRB04474.1 hypothetical protein EHT25_13335 [Larkinella rosea]